MRQLQEAADRLPGFELVAFDQGCCGSQRHWAVSIGSPRHAEVADSAVRRLQCTVSVTLRADVARCLSVVHAESQTGRLVRR